MTTTEFLEREIRRAEISLRHAQRKPNTPEEELRGLNEKIEHLQEAKKAVDEYWQRVHEERGWVARIDREKWNPCEECKGLDRHNCDTCEYDLVWKFLEPCKSCYDSKHWKPSYKFCPSCGRPLTEDAWEELERRVCGG